MTDKSGRQDDGLPSFERVSQLLSYDPVNGIFRNRIARGKSAVGKRMGHATKYRREISIDGKVCREHRLAWLLSYGTWPTKSIDHINGDPHDNRLCNLREATHSQNMANSKRSCTNTSGFKGVSCDGRRTKKKWYARIRDNGQHRSLGYFHTPEEAHAAYEAEAKIVHGEFARMS